MAGKEIMTFPPANGIMFFALNPVLAVIGAFAALINDSYFTLEKRRVIFIKKSFYDP